MTTLSAKSGKHAVTMRDVARRAGVALKTVSRVVNDEPGVRDTTRHRVAAAVTELGYVPNVSARRLAAGRSRLLGLVFYSDSAASGGLGYLASLEAGAHARCRRAGYGLLLHPWHDSGGDPRAEALRLAEQSGVDGLILTPPADDPDFLEPLAALGIPYALVTPRRAGDDSHSIFGGDRAGAAALAEHLLALGHRRIGFVAGPDGYAMMSERRAGFEAALAARGVPPDPALMTRAGFTFGSGIACGRELLARRPPPTAIFACSDETAAGVLMAAHQLGHRVPGDLSVAGFDDVPIARQLWPRLTTVRMPIEEFGARAAERVLAELAGERGLDPGLPLGSALVVRDSTGPPPPS